LALDLVDLLQILVVSIVFAEIYRRVLFARYRARLVQALNAAKLGQDTPDVQAARAIAVAGLHVALRAILVRDDDGRWHLTPYARAAGRAGLQAVGELVKVGPPRGGSGQGTLDLAGLDLDQLVAAGIGMMPRKQQGWAAMGWGIIRPLLGPFIGKILGPRAGAKTPPASTENPFLKDLIP